MKKSNLKEFKNQLDSIAQTICKIVPVEQRLRIFEEQKIISYYVKGKKKGQLREFYTVDGFGFEKLWKLIYPYVFKSCRISSTEEDLEDLIYEVKYQVFRNLQYYGPVFENQTLSQRLGLIVNNTLTNEFRKRSTRVVFVRTSTNYFDDFSDEEFLNYAYRKKQQSEEPAATDYQSFVFWAQVPPDIKECVMKIVNDNLSLEKVSKLYNNTVLQKLMKFSNSLL
jgi:DNA-directed RNA polymerase specialized sigma24 family protein